MNSVGYHLHNDEFWGETTYIFFEYMALYVKIRIAFMRYLVIWCIKVSAKEAGVLSRETGQKFYIQTCNRRTYLHLKVSVPHKKDKKEYIERT